jgi:hypothetical protein
VELDLSGVMPEARPAVERAANVYIAHTRRWFVGILAHGSAVKGGFIPGCSDIDLKLYLEPDAFTAEGYLPFAISLAIARDLAPVDPAPFAYIQCYAHSIVSQHQQLLIPGTHALLAGRLPVAEATETQLQAQARTALSTSDPLPPHLRDGLLTWSPSRLERNVRWLCTDVWPMLYHLLSVQQRDALRIWRLPKQEAIALTDPQTAEGQAIRAFYAALLAYYPAQTSNSVALDILEHGVHFLRAATSWWQRECGVIRADVVNSTG